MTRTMHADAPTPGPQPVSTSCRHGTGSRYGHPVRWLPLILLLVLHALLAGCAGGRVSATETPARVLFVGNSLIYVGNTPAVYAALAAANGHAVESDMIVRGGATLAQRVADGTAAAALAMRPYAALVLQERGGDLMCSFGPASCTDSTAAIQTLADLARARGTPVVLLGTYQPHPEASRSLVEAEAAAAQAAGIAYLEISETLQQLRNQAPDATWFAPDGVHPGKDLTLLNAARVYQALHRTLPKPSPLTVAAPIYNVRSGLTEALRPANAPPPLPDTPLQTTYTAEALHRIVDAIRPK